MTPQTSAWHDCGRRGADAMRAEDLCRLGTLAIQEHEAWEARNKARAERQLFLRTYNIETGDRFDYDEAEPNDRVAFNTLTKSAEATQRVLTTARCATRRMAKKLRSAAP